LFDELGLILVDFKLEFGKDIDGKVLLADEFSPDTSRLWDKKTLEKLDKDRFRFDLGDLMSGYREVLARLEKRLAV
jgi:phosphoribosylaminoimidazole-succinocarboxamide synthase